MDFWLFLYSGSGGSYIVLPPFVVALYLRIRILLFVVHLIFFPPHFFLSNPPLWSSWQLLSLSAMLVVAEQNSMMSLHKGVRILPSLGDVFLGITGEGDIFKFGTNVHLVLIRFWWSEFKGQGHCHLLYFQS